MKKDKITKEHLKIAVMIIKGYTRNDIAKNMKYSIGTVRNRIADLYKKFDITGPDNFRKRIKLDYILRKSLESGAQQRP